jgi:hypothetical protein
MSNIKTLYRRKNKVTEKHVTFNVIGEGHSYTVKLQGGYLKVIADAVDRHLLIDSSGNVVTDSLPGKDTDSK